MESIPATNPEIHDHPPLDSTSQGWWRWSPILLGLLLVVITVLPYAELPWQDFVNYDDTVFVTKNTHINRGLTALGFEYAFGTNSVSQYHPLTWFSHMLDVELFGVVAGPMKVHNLLLHTLSALLLFHLCRRVTGSLAASFLFAAFWAVHPMRVEAVAWVSERKEVLCCLFGLLTLHAYVSYTRAPHPARYALLFLLFACTLMSKPMLVTLPCVMLLLDIWPLRRTPLTPDSASRQGWATLILEKLPLVPLIVGSAYMTILCQQAALTFAPLDEWSFTQRLANSFVATGWYLKSLFAPYNLTVLYPRPRFVPPSDAVFAAVVVVLISWLAVRQLRTRPWLFVGWFGFLGMLVPVIGPVTVGGQAYADRYGYLPHLMLMAAVAAALVPLWKPRFGFMTVLAGLVLAVLMAVTAVQVGYWRNSATLWSRNLHFFPNNATGLNNLAATLHEAMDTRQAVPYYIRATIERPTSEAGINLGIAMLQQSRPEEAERYLRRFIRVRPQNADARVNLAAALWDQGRLKEAAEQLRTALAMDPDNTLARDHLRSVMHVINDPRERVENLKRAISMPHISRAGRVRLAAACLREGLPQPAYLLLKSVLSEEPGHEQARSLLRQMTNGKPTSPELPAKTPDAQQETGRGAEE